MRLPSRSRLVSLAALILFALAGCTTGATAQQRAETPTTTSTNLAATPTTGATTPSPTGSGITLAWRRYTDTTFGFALDVPAEWDFYSNDSGYHSAQFQGAYAGPSTFAQLWIGVTDVPNRITTSEQQYCSGAKTVTVAGYPAVVGDQEPKPGTVTGGASLQRYFVANGLFYDIHLTSLLDLDHLRARLGPTYAHILDSFQPGASKPGNAICPSA